jgi:hypothetical protein
LQRTRWWLAGVRQAIPWLRERCLATVWRTLHRWKLAYKRGRRHVHSPDWEYETKVQRIETITWYSRQAPKQIVRLYEDELTYYRQPTLAQGYALCGSDAPHAEQGTGYNTARRIAACLDVETGRLLAWQRSHFDHETLLKFYRTVEAAYPQADQVFLIHDNWPVHWRPDVLEGLRGSKLTLVSLPTYAPWRESRGEGVAQVVSRRVAFASLGTCLGAASGRSPTLVRSVGRRVSCLITLRWFVSYVIWKTS